MTFSVGHGRRPTLSGRFARAVVIALIPWAFCLHAEEPSPNPIPNPNPNVAPNVTPNPNAAPGDSRKGRIPDAFEPRLNGAEDDKDPPAETVTLPPVSPKTPPPRPVDEHAMAANRLLGMPYDFGLLTIDYDALKAFTYDINGAPPEREAKKWEPYDWGPLTIDFEALKELTLAEKSAPPVAAVKSWAPDGWVSLEIELNAYAQGGTARLTLPEPTDARPPAPEPDKIELAITLDAPLLKPGEDALFSLMGPDSFLSEAAGEYQIGDELGRQIAHGLIPINAIPAAEGQPRQFRIAPPLELALAPEKYSDTSGVLKLHADFEFYAPGKKHIKLGADCGVERPLEPRVKEWDRWIALSASPPPNGAWGRLNALGIFGGMQIRISAARRESLKKGNAPFYVENVTKQMLSRYHTEKGLWQKTIAAMAANRDSGVPLSRDPSLCSPAFAEAFGGEIARIGEAYAADPPLFFSLASEPSMTRLNSAADFDFSPPALDEFRRWLERDAYGTLPALNEAWGTKFDSWQTVVPMSTDDARMRLKDGIGNFAPWADFREFQDYTFAKVLREGADLLRTKVPNAKVGITGAMGPFAFGGWDWSRLSAELDVVEAYDIGGARTLWRDLAPGKPALAAITLPMDGKADAAPEISRALWQFALDGGPRGALFWDAPGGGSNTGGALVDSTGELTELAKALAPTLNELAGEAGQILAQSKRMDDGVAVLYSPASVRMQWLFEADALHGSEWLQTWGLDSGAERRESPQLRLRESWGKLLDDCGVGWRFVSTHEIERGVLVRADGGIKTLILPRTIALSDREAEAIRKFCEHGGQVVADAVCGRFDDHGKLRAKPALDEMFGVNTATEPVFAQPMKALNRVAALPGTEGPMAKWELDFWGSLPPVFSDEPKWVETERSGKRKGAEYRMSPVFAARGSAMFLNLDFTDYLRWRLHPELPRARAARRVLTELVLGKALEESPVDWNKTQLPYGTQLIRFRVGSATNPGYIFALRRNPQARLHELGVEGDANLVFEKAEPFALHLKENSRLVDVYPRGSKVTDSGAKGAGHLITGALDPVSPVVLMFQAGEPVKLALAAPEKVAKLQRLEVAVQPPPDARTPALFVIRVLGPDGSERRHYGGVVNSKDGMLSHIFSFASNDPAGVWTVAVRDALSGAGAEVRIEVKEAER